MSGDAVVDASLYCAGYVLIYPYGKDPYGTTHVLFPARARDQIYNVSGVTCCEMLHLVFLCVEVDVKVSVFLCPQILCKHKLHLRHGKSPFIL